MDMKTWTLRRIRRSKGYTQQNCADQIGISRSYYAQIESSARPMKLDQAQKLSAFLGISLDDLFVALNDAGSIPGETIIKTGTED